MSARPRAARALAAAALLTIGAWGATVTPARPLAAQEPGGASFRYGARVTAPHAHGTAVAAALRVPTGSQDDPPGEEGTAWLMALTLQDQVSRALGAGTAAFDARVERASIVFTLLAAPGEWEAAWAKVDSVLFRAPLDAALLERHRAVFLERIVFEAGSPFRDFQGEAARLLAEPGSASARPPYGTRSSLGAVGAASLEAFRGLALRPGRAVLAVVGPVDDVPFLAPPDTARLLPARERPWTEGRRTALVQDITSTWLAVAWPVSPGVPRTHLELVAHLLEEDLDPVPPDPDRYGVDVRAEETPAGPVLVVEASVFPEAAARWEARILGSVERLSSEPLGDDFFGWRRRRFRAARLLEEAAPEVEARRLTADLLRDGRPRNLTEEIWALDAAALRRAAEGLGPPRILLLGPDLGSQQGPR